MIITDRFVYVHEPKTGGTSTVSSTNVRVIHAAVAKQLRRLTCERRWTKDLEVGDAVRADVPALQHQAGIVEAMVVVEVTEDGVSHVRALPAGFQQPVVCARSMIDDDGALANFDKVATALPCE